MIKIISKIFCVLCAVVFACSPAVYADGVEDEILSGKYRNPYSLTKSGSSGNLYDDTRYNNSSPAQSVEDFLNGVTDGVVEAFNTGIDILADYYRHSFDPTSYTDPAQINETFQHFIKFGADALMNLVHAQRIKDLVDYANQSTTGLTTGQNVIAFIAKRNLPLSFTNPSDNYEVDTMYYWRDFNHTESNNLNGVTIGNFYMRPNTIYVTRQFSNGDFKCFYCDATQFDLRITQANADFVNSRFVLEFQAGKTYYINNPDGTTEQITFPVNSFGASVSSLRFLDLNGSTVNNTIEDDFARQAYYFPKFSEYITDGVLSNIQLMCNNATKSDGSMMRPNNYSGSADGWEKWFMSSGAFIDNGYNSLSGVTQTFTTNNYNYDPRKPPAVYNFDNRLTTNNILTPETVSNYTDYGISYSYLTNSFNLDVNALAAGLAAELDPLLHGNFDLVYDNQPDIGGSDWLNLPNNYNTDFDTTITDIGDLITSLVPTPEGWQPPKFPAITTVNPPSLLGTMTFPVQTRPAEYDDAVNVLWDTGTEMTESTGLLSVFIFMAIIGLVVYVLM